VKYLVSSVNARRLRVAEAQARDANRSIVRIDAKVMEELDLALGDAVEITGTKMTVALVWPGYESDNGKGLIRTDSYVRNNAGVSVDGQVNVRKITVKLAEEVVLGFSEPIRVKGIEAYLHEFLQGRVLTRGDSIPLNIMGTRVELIVTDLKPRVQALLVDKTTEIKVSEKVARALKTIQRVNYEDIGGLHEQKQLIRESAETALSHPEVFTRMGVPPPKGVLLYGPHGCGKTMLARAVANVPGVNGWVPFYIHGSSGTLQLTDVFEKAQKIGHCVIFIDALEKVSVDQLLPLMESIEGAVVVIGATETLDAVDKSLRRPGVFDQEIAVPLPDEIGRRDILRIHTETMPLASDVDLTRLSAVTGGYTGAELASLCRMAAMNACRRSIPGLKLDTEQIPPADLQKIIVTLTDFDAALRKLEKPGQSEEKTKVY